jgi:hypothetical protein
MKGPGVTPGIASIDSGYGMVGNPSDFLSDDVVDATTLGFVRSGHDYAVERHRRQIYSIPRPSPFADNTIYWDLNTVSGPHAANVWYSYPAGGLYVPSFAVSRQTGLTSSRTIRVAVSLAVSGAADWQIRTSTGTHTGGTVVAALGYRWHPMEASGVYDRTLNGAAATVGLSGEWIYIQMRVAGATDSATIKGISIWEDEQ